MLYFMKGSNAIMRWDYKVDDGGAKLQYIIWSVQNKTTSRFYTILFEDTDKGSVNVSTQIPQMYVGRVEKTGRATFVIKNLIYEDSAKYTLTLDQTFGQDPGSVVQLTVTGTASLFFYFFICSFFIFMLHINYKLGYNLLKHFQKIPDILSPFVNPRIASLSFPQCWFHVFGWA